MKKQLHHYSQLNTYQFITYRNRASIDAFLVQLKDSNLDEPLKQYSVDQYIDQSALGRLLNDKIIDLIMLYCHNLDLQYYRLICLSVMPNHVHILFEQNTDLGMIMHKLKEGLASLISKRLGLSGSLWERDYFDKAIKDEKHFQVTYNYIKHNASQADLADANARFYGVSEAQVD